MWCWLLDAALWLISNLVPSVKETKFTSNYCVTEKISISLSNIDFGSNLVYLRSNFSFEQYSTRKNTYDLQKKKEKKKRYFKRLAIKTLKTKGEVSSIK